MDRFQLNEKGQGLTEYITLLILVSLVAVGAAQTLGTTLKRKIQTAREHIDRDIHFSNVK
jgi:Flp pilus assembly pilin Flp